MPLYLWSDGADGGAVKLIEQRLRMVIPGLVAVSSIDEILAVRRNGLNDRTYVAVVLPNRAPDEFARLIEVAARHRDQLFLVLISDDLSVENYKLLTRTGGADLGLHQKTDTRELLDIVRRHKQKMATAKSEPSSERRPVVISFVPSSGGVAAEPCRRKWCSSQNR